MSVNVAMREKGLYPISIGTSLALEGVMGQHPDRPLPHSQLPKYKEVWFNLHTLFRNLVSSMKAEEQRAATIPEIVPGLVEDALGCQAVIEHEGKGRVNSVFYLPDYSGLHLRYPSAKIKEPTTDNQLIYQTLHDATIRRFMVDPPVAVRHEKIFITGRHPAALMLTHLPVDLLARYQFDRLDLLESHTGKIKPASQWNTKLTGKPEDVAMLPFLPFTLQVFGDGQQFVHQLRGLKDAVIETARETQWSSVTTLDKVKATLDRHVKNKEVLVQLQRFY